jgi:hypothetical protein
MSNFVWGALFGALAMYLYLEGVTPVVDVARDVWSSASRAPVESKER